MVDQWMKSMNKTPALQPANAYDPWAAWKAGQDPYAPQQTTNWGQVTQRTETTLPDWGPYQRANPVTFDYAQQGPPPSTPSGIDPTYATGNAPQQTTYSYPTGSTVASASAAQPWLTPAATPPAASGGTAAWAGQDYRLPSGEVLPGAASFTLDILGQQVRAPGYYDPNSATGGKPARIFQTAQGMEDAIGRFSRRLSDAARAGENPNDPNVIYRELARVRDDAMVALGLSPNDPQLGAKLRAATGFVHLDRFVRGANGETGFTPAPGTGAGTAGGGAGAGAAGGGAGAGTGQGSGSGAGAAGATGGGIFPSEVEMELARQSPEYAIAAYRKARGGGQDKSAVGDFREGMMGQAVRAYLTMLGAGGPGGNPVGMANQGMGDIVKALASGSGVGGILRAQAQQMMGQDLSGFDDKQLLAMMGAAQGAGGFGLGPFAQYALDNSYGDMEHLAQQNALSGSTTSALANPAARKKFMDDLARYLAVR